ncbi:MAG: ribbon-helix-helix protein, CopG family [Burkholderiaceae bacterium]
MPDLERLTITMPSELAATIKAAVAGGDYASSSEVIREALREWRIRRTVQVEELATLKADIEQGLADVAAGRLESFDAERIVERGRKLLARQ